MKTISALIALLTLWIIPNASAQNARRDSADIVIRLNNSFNGNTTVDSVFIILDRYDLTGAGTIKKVFYPSKNHILIKNVPRGKYYVDVVCLGLYSEYFTRTTFITERRKNRLKFRLHRTEEYLPGSVSIPPYAFDLTKLAITDHKSYK